ncbi:unnamed protein product [Mytilus edulis]|uniref:DUF3504 domain-containing protein n=1 Tax=Mytilus edulis TaxID=6550 RepID=A0A8S3UVE1_MYTED|nr:unnamed protein product [Mytilus edulis]
MFDDSSSAVKMNRYTVSPLKIGLRVDYKGASYKITDHLMEQNAVRQYIIQSMADGGTKRVFRHEICDARVSSVFSNLTEDTIFNFENNEQSQSDEELSQIDEDLTANCINQEPPAKKPRFKELPSKEEIEKLALARTEPRTNQQTLWGVKLLRGFLGHYAQFRRKGQEGLAELKKTSYAKSKDHKGQEYYQMTYNECDKTHHGVDSKENSRDVRMYAKPGDIHCPVFSLNFYLGKLSPRCTAFFQQALQYPKPTVWLAAQPIGKNKLASMMSRISDEAGLSIRYTNHCMRATVATGLKRAGSMTGL